jgi:hypothetical protein
LVAASTGDVGSMVADGALADAVALTAAASGEAIVVSTGVAGSMVEVVDSMVVEVVDSMVVEAVDSTAVEVVDSMVVEAVDSMVAAATAAGTGKTPSSKFEM